MKVYVIILTIFAVVGVLGVTGKKGNVRGKKWNRNRVIDRLHMKGKIENGIGKKWWADVSKWTTILKDKANVSETGFISKKFKLMVVRSADENLENSEYNKAATIVDFALDKVAIRVNLPNIPSAINQPNSFYPNLQTNETNNKGDKAGSLKSNKNNTLINSNGDLSTRHPGGSFGFNLGRRPGRRFGNRNQSGFRKQFGRLSMRNGRGRALGRQRRKGFRRRSWKKIGLGKWNRQRGKQICFIMDSQLSIKEANDELKLRADGEAVLTGNEKTFTVKLANSPTTIDLKSIGRHLRRFCRFAIQTGNIFNVTEGTTTQSNAKIFRILGQIDVTQPGASIPYEIQVDSSIDLR